MILNLHLPVSGKILIKAGESVDFETPLVKEKKTKDIKLNLSEKMGLEPTKIFRSLIKFVGEEIKKGELLAEKKSFFDHKKLVSEFDGILKEVNHKEGTILIEIKSGEEKTHSAYFKGEVVSIEKDLIKIKVNKSSEFPLKEVFNLEKEEGGGEVYYLQAEKTEIFEEDIAGKIIFIDKISGYLQAKLEALGAAGFVSLHGLSEKTNLVFGKLKQVGDAKKILEAKLPYCIVDKKESRIIFYQ